MTTKWFNNGKTPPAGVLENIMQYMKKMETYVYLGRISTEIGYTLGQTEAFMQVLSEKNLARVLTIDEKNDLKIDSRANLWTLVK